jgi:hypothetical protein
MSSPALRTLLAVATVIVVGLAGVVWLQRSAPSTSSPTTAPTSTPLASTSPPPSPVPSPTPVASVALGATFTSARYGYSIKPPAGWTISPASADWAVGAVLTPDATEADRFGDAEHGAIVIASQPLPTGMTAAAWLSQYERRRAAVLGTSCGGGSWQATTLVGTDAWTSVTDCGSAGVHIPVEEVILVRGDRGWSIGGDEAFLDAVLSTITLP